MNVRNANLRIIFTKIIFGFFCVKGNHSIYIECQQNLYFCEFNFKAEKMDSDGELGLEIMMSQSQLKSEEQGAQLKPKEILSKNDIKEMLQTRSRLVKFIDQMKQVKKNKLRNDVLQHCERTKLQINDYYSTEIIEKMVRNRIEKMVKNKKFKKNWSEEDVKILIWTVSKYSDFKGIHSIDKDLTIQDWEYIASIIPGVQAEGCMFKWLSLKKNNLTQHAWGERQSQLLEKLTKKYGDRDWSIISQKLYFMNPNPYKIYRCPKQCREHWNCYLNPNLKKGPWTKEEDLLLLSIIKKNKCQKKWAEMACHFQGRTENALKNRYTLIIEKQMKLYPKPQKLTQLAIIEGFLEKSYVQQFVDDSSKKSIGVNERMRTRRREAEQKKKSSLDETENIPIHPMNGSEFEKTALSHSKEEQMLEIEKISIVKANSDQLKELVAMILSEKSDYVPCSFDNYKLKKISKI